MASEDMTSELVSMVSITVPIMNNCIGRAFMSFLPIRKNTQTRVFRVGLNC